MTRPRRAGPVERFFNELNFEKDEDYD